MATDLPRDAVARLRPVGRRAVLDVRSERAREGGVVGACERPLARGEDADLDRLATAGRLCWGRLRGRNAGICRRLGRGRLFVVPAAAGGERGDEEYQRPEDYEKPEPAAPSI